MRNLLTNISASNIIDTSTADITQTVISRTDKLKGEDKLANTALTEAVYYILLSLTEPLHGYGIIQNAEKLSSGRVKLAAGTLYGAINSLIEKGWIEALPEETASRKKEYIITQSGKEILMAEIERLRELLRNGEEILGGFKDE